MAHKETGPRLYHGHLRVPRRAGEPCRGAAGAPITRCDCQLAVLGRAREGAAECGRTGRAQVPPGSLWGSTGDGHDPPHLAAGPRGRPLLTQGFLSRGPRTPPPGEGESTLGSGKPLPAASVQKPRAPSQPLPAPPGPTVLEPVAVAKHVLQSLPLQPLSAELGPCPSRTTASEMGNR